MTIIEEKRSILINKIQQTEDEDLLDFMNEIAFENKLDFQFSNELLDIVNKIDKEMDNGEFYTSEEMDNIIESWN